MRSTKPVNTVERVYAVRIGRSTYVAYWPSVSKEDDGSFILGTDGSPTQHITDDPAKALLMRRSWAINIARYIRQRYRVSASAKDMTSAITHRAA